jgi:prefoldin alpha subunit
MEQIDEKQQELIYKFSMFEQQIQQINEQLGLVEQGMNELRNLKEGIDEIKGKKDEEILAHIGRGIFVKAKILSDDLIVDIGKKNFVEKTPEETKAMINKQIKRIEEIKESLNNSLQEMNSEMVKMIEEVEKS